MADSQTIDAKSPADLLTEGYAKYFSRKGVWNAAWGPKPAKEDMEAFARVHVARIEAEYETHRKPSDPATLAGKLLTDKDGLKTGKTTNKFLPGSAEADISLMRGDLATFRAKQMADVINPPEEMPEPAPTPTAPAQSIQNEVITPMDEDLSTDQPEVPESELVSAPVFEAATPVTARPAGPMPVIPDIIPGEEPATPVEHDTRPLADRLADPRLSPAAQNAVKQYTEVFTARPPVGAPDDFDPAALAHIHVLGMMDRYNADGHAKSFDQALQDRSDADVEALGIVGEAGEKAMDASLADYMQLKTEAETAPSAQSQPNSDKAEIKAEDNITSPASNSSSATGESIEVEGDPITTDDGFVDHSLFADISSETAKLIAKGAQDKSDTVTKFDRYGIAALLATNSGFANEQSLLMSLRALAHKHGLSLEQLVAIHKAGKITRLNTNGTEELLDINVPELATQVFAQNSTLIQNPQHPGMGFVGYQMKSTGAKLFPKQTLVMFDAYGNQYFDNGHSTWVELATASTKTVNGETVKTPGRQSDAETAYNMMNLHILRRMKKSANGSAQTMKLRLKPKGIGSVSRMNELRDMNLLVALDVAQKNNIDLEISTKSRFSPVSRTIGHLELKKLNKRAVSQMARLGIDAESVIKRHNEALNNKGYMEIISDEPTAAKMTPRADPDQIMPNTPNAESILLRRAENLASSQSTRRKTSLPKGMIAAKMLKAGDEASYGGNLSDPANMPATFRVQETQFVEATNSGILNDGEQAPKMPRAPLAELQGEALPGVTSYSAKGKASFAGADYTPAAVNAKSDPIHIMPAHTDARKKSKMSVSDLVSNAASAAKDAIGRVISPASQDGRLLAGSRDPNKNRTQQPPIPGGPQ